jgi:sterol desaturase/sphingolipid hydroxylase (fatty acid hydroxylase superfamily)
MSVLHIASETYQALMNALVLMWATIAEKIASSIAWQTFAVLSAFFVAVVFVEWMTNRRISRYLEASFFTDLLYTFLIVGGAYAWLQQPIVTWIDSVLRQSAPLLYTDLLQKTPEPLQLIVFLVAVDFCRYWKHRWMHSVPALQAIHSVHHAPENLNFLTTYRIHLLEYIFDGIVTLVPVVLLGLPPEMWLPVYLSLVLLSALNHSDIDLGFGWLNRIVVSPRFHATHHSSDRREYNCNFASLFSFWDVLFCTANFRSSRPDRYGLSKLGMPPSFVGQLFFPIKQSLRRLRLGRPIVDILRIAMRLLNRLIGRFIALQRRLMAERVQVTRRGTQAGQLHEDVPTHTKGA